MYEGILKTLTMNIVTIHHTINEKYDEEWFFSTDHCQKGLPEDFVPITTYNTTVEKIREYNNNSCIIGATNKEIANPNKDYIPDYIK